MLVFWNHNEYNLEVIRFDAKSSGVHFLRFRCLLHYSSHTFWKFCLLVLIFSSLFDLKLGQNMLFLETSSEFLIKKIASMIVTEQGRNEVGFWSIFCKFHWGHLCTAFGALFSLISTRAFFLEICHYLFIKLK